MTYKEAIILLKNDGSNKAYRSAWSTKTTNIHIWKEKGVVCKADRDGWPQSYLPTTESINATDWHVSNYNDPLVIKPEEKISNIEIDKLI